MQIGEMTPQVQTQMGDGVFDTIDLDDDNDGILDTIEGTGDTDADAYLIIWI